ncbi:hypothetical protein AG1IA_06802 [Rhizoctonia solani AG-1 IA]|uniref:Uncharacterized protein n=1 Tax=Thanatephorus cucumeris (strain AG1-IA) TaxID=983506 RepID=L8WQX7_THACA|nr:hypothetical protein AG1IA_06802 [Rhizoctonia solani AG-1 IA]
MWLRCRDSGLTDVMDHCTTACSVVMGSHEIYGFNGWSDDNLKIVTSHVCNSLCSAGNQEKANIVVNTCLKERGIPENRGMPKTSSDKRLGKGSESGNGIKEKGPG